MEIYKLSDEVPSEKKQSARGRDAWRDDACAAELKITSLKQGAKNPNRINVFIDERFGFSLDIAQVVDYKLKVGKKISVEELSELKKASEFGKLYHRTLEWTLLRPRSEREVRDYLLRKLKKSSSEDILQLSQDILQRLISKGYVDDKKFAEWYVENRFIKKGISKKRLQIELIKKGIPRDIIVEVLDGRDDEEEIRKIIAKKRAKYDDEKLIQYLCRQGFPYDLVKNLVEED